MLDLDSSWAKRDFWGPLRVEREGAYFKAPNEYVLATRFYSHKGTLKLDSILPLLPKETPRIVIKIGLFLGLRDHSNLTVPFSIVMTAINQNENTTETLVDIIDDDNRWIDETFQEKLSLAGGWQLATSGTWLERGVLRIPSCSIRLKTKASHSRRTT